MYNRGGKKMKSNQKGFTLIELLAVIVILAIIALIATPIVLNIIEKARKSAAADSVYGLMEAVKLAYTESLLDSNSKTLPLTVTCTETSCDNNVTVSGTRPVGSITLSAGGQFSIPDKADGSAGVITVNGIDCTLSGQTVTCGE